MWKNYGNNHTIFDASASTSPDGGAVNNSNSAVAWTATYPTLMGWNGTNTYGVRVDSARISDSTSGNAATVTTNANLTGHVTSVGNAAVLGSFTSAQLATALTDETGSGSAVFATSPTLVTPALGTPSSGNLSNCTFPTLNQSTTGNAATATVLQTARTINGVSFDGSTNINISASEFASGTTIVFYQASAPTGWTKSTSHDNKALRVVSGTGGGSGGSVDFTTAFASRGVPLPEHAHSASLSTHDGHQHSGPTNNANDTHEHTFTTNDNGGHNHDFSTNSAGSHQHSMNQYGSGSEAGGYGLYPNSAPYGGAFGDRPKVNGSASDYTNSAGDHSHSGSTTSVGNHNHSGTTAGMNRSHYHDFATQTGGEHGHSLTINNNGTASASMDFRVQYIDVIICSKN
jgi:hypothetical protein